MEKKGKKVFVGLSGGVDSSVAAALLKDRGYTVEGVFIKVWQPAFLKCSWPEDRLDAMRVCAVLGIPFRTLDLSNEYKKEVVDYMISEYKVGRTPNPDVMCNRYIKFGKFLEYALKEGADYIATGHYARVTIKEDELFLQKGVDEKKDQSYFLWTLTQNDLKHVLFPIGDVIKSDTRKLAMQFKLPTATKSESQGLCFLGEVNLKEFLSEFIDISVGDVLSEDGNVIGVHDGAIIYTLGQRHGFTILNKEERERPHYVVSKDIKSNTITVSESVAETQNNEYISLIKTNWINAIPDLNVNYFAKIRHQGASLVCNVFENGAKVKFLGKADAVACGQSIVIYDEEVCIGGGVAN
ncbi:MAG: tRNA 2-thiouridine(34) synthase MnmA [Parcubacteria group bacterium]|nr:tRNA 2-thiouridine(34) synthase MnmA [Parcubacteria group bacterium]